MQKSQIHHVYAIVLFTVYRFGQSFAIISFLKDLLGWLVAAGSSYWPVSGFDSTMISLSV